MAVVFFSMFICYTVTVVVDTVTADLFSYAAAGTSVIDNAVAVVIQFVTADFYISRRNADFTGKCKLLQMGFVYSFESHIKYFYTFRCE